MTRGSPNGGGDLASGARGGGARPSRRSSAAPVSSSRPWRRLAAVITGAATVSAAASATVVASGDSTSRAAISSPTARTVVAVATGGTATTMASAWWARSPSGRCSVWSAAASRPAPPPRPLTPTRSSVGSIRTASAWRVAAGPPPTMPMRVTRVIFAWWIAQSASHLTSGFAHGAVPCDHRARIRGTSPADGGADRRRPRGRCLRGRPRAPRERGVDGQRLRRGGDQSRRAGPPFDRLRLLRRGVRRSLRRGEPAAWSPSIRSARS